MTHFSPSLNSTDEEKIDSFKNFYKEYIFDEKILKADIEKLADLIDKATYYLSKNPERLNDTNEILNWNSIDRLVRNQFSSKIYTKVYAKILSKNIPKYHYPVDKGDGFLKIIGKTFGNADLKLLNNAAVRLPFLKALHYCLKVEGLHDNIKKRDLQEYKKYHVRLKPIGISDEYAFFLNENALKEIIKAHKGKRQIPFNGRYVPYHPDRKIKISSSILKEDEVTLFLLKNGVYLYNKKKWWKSHSKDFFKLCKQEPNIEYDYPNFHPEKIIPSENTVQIDSTLFNFDNLLKGTSTLPYIDIEPNINRDVIKRTDEKTKVIPVGKYKALIIGVSDYKDLRPLKYPVSDAEKLKELLETKYGFSDTIFLKNPTKNDIIDAFDDLETGLNKGDNLLIFYAGHSYREMNRGYWMPKDAYPNRRRNWIENSIIFTYFERLEKCQHILLIDDSCFSGSWLETRKTNFINGLNKANTILYQSKSRTVFTSGAKNEEVMDKSEFFKQVYNALNENNLPSFNLSSKFYEIQKKVILDTSFQKPQYGKLPDKFDDDGQFIFYKNGKKP